MKRLKSITSFDCFFFSSCPTLTECIVCKCDNDERAVADMFRILCIPSIRPHHRSCSCPNANRRNPNDSVAGARCPDHWTPPSNGTWSAGTPPCWTAQRERVPKHCETHTNKHNQFIIHWLALIKCIDRIASTIPWSWSLTCSALSAW